MPDQTTAEDYRQIEPWQGDEQSLLDGARRKVTPDGSRPAEVKVVAHDDIIVLCSALLGRKKRHRMAKYVLRQPIYVRDLPSLEIPHQSDTFDALYGEYSVREPTVIFFFVIEEGVAKPTYVVCHPEFHVDYPAGFGNVESIRRPVHSPRHTPTRR